MRKRLISLALAVALVCGTLPVPALAEESSLSQPAASEIGSSEQAASALEEIPDSAASTETAVSNFAAVQADSVPEDGAVASLARAGEITYLDEKGVSQVYSGTYDTVTASSTEWTDGWYLAEGEVAIDQQVTVSGDVKLILADGAKLTVDGGIDVASGNAFTVYAQSTGEQMGSLESTNYEYESLNAHAGIGSAPNQDAGTITINGGKVLACGSRYAAGIGSAANGNAGVITINGGIVNASLRDFYGSGIGAGDKGNGGIITINGGEIDAYGYKSAGIGAGSGGNSIITINGGTIRASAGGGAAGIGGGSADSAGTVITINGGNITAVGSTSGSNGAPSGAGIGGGGSNNNVDIIITGGVITATGGTDNGFYSSRDAAGIGGGSFGSVNSITISGGIITANSDSVGLGKTNAFSTGADGNAVIFASSIPDLNDREQWQGLIFEGGNGKIYGENYTVESSLTIPEGKILTVESGKTLTVASGANLQNNGEVRINRGGIYAGSEPNGNPLSYQIEWDTDGDGTMDDSTYSPKGELPAHEDGEKAPDQQQVYSFEGWQPELETVTGNAQYTAVFVGSPRPYTVTIPENQTGYQVNPLDDTTVLYGENFQFTVTFADGYEEGENFAVKANGVTLDADEQGIYCVQILGETAITVEGIADVAAPTVTAEWRSFLPEDTRFTEGGDFWATSTGGYIFIEASDPSGVAALYYQLSGEEVVSEPNSYAMIRMNNDFRGTLTVWAVDNAGNESRHITFNEFCLEKTAPEAPTVDTNGYDGNWTSESVTLTPSSSALSGIDHYEYSKDGGANWEMVTGNELTVSQSGFATDYIFRAVSVAGNTSGTSTPVTVKIDKMGPDLLLKGNTEEYLPQDTVEIIPIIGLTGISSVQVKDEEGNWVSLTPTEAGSFSYKYTVTQNGTYTFRAISGVGVAGDEVTITYDKIDNVKPVVEIDSGSYIADSWTGGAVTLTPANVADNLGETTYQYKVDNGSWKTYTGAVVASDETPGTTYTFKAVSASGIESDETSITVRIDKTVPDGDIKIAENSAKKLLNDISFGLFFNKTVDVTITGEDALSGVAGIEYYRSENILTEEEVKQISDWTEYTSISEKAEDAARFVYYVKITDQAGNTTIFGSDGVVFDTAAPNFSGALDGASYYTTQTVTVIDANLASLTLNGAAVSSPVTIPGDVDAVYTLVAVDKAGNRAQITVTMQSLADLDDGMDGIDPDNVTSQDRDEIESVLDKVEDLLQGDSLTESEKEKLEDKKDELEDLLDKLDQAQDAGSTENMDKTEGITSENVQTGDKSDLEAAKEDIENALENFGDNYTEEEKSKLEEALDRIESALETINKVEHVQESVNALPDTVEPDELDTVEKIEAAKEQYDSLNDHEKNMVGQDVVKKLNDLLAATTNYKILEGNGSVWTLNGTDSLTIRANGSPQRLTALKMDGQLLAQENYTVRAGSTIVTLKAEYLNTLTPGEHTLTFVYSNGQTEAVFTVAAAPAQTQTETTDNGGDSTADNTATQNVSAANTANDGNVNGMPQTGDDFAMNLWIGLAVLCGAALVALNIYRRKKANKQ